MTDGHVSCLKEHEGIRRRRHRSAHCPCPVAVFSFSSFPSPRRQGGSCSHQGGARTGWRGTPGTPVGLGRLARPLSRLPLQAQSQVNSITWRLNSPQRMVSGPGGSVAVSVSTQRGSCGRRGPSGRQRGLSGWCRADSAIVEQT